MVNMGNISVDEKINSIKKGDLKAEDNINYFLKRINDKNKEYNIFLQLDEENALETARNIDERIKNGENTGRLAGLCFGIKSNISVEGLNISCASKTLEDYKGTFDADVIKRIKEEDGIILGMLNNDEFACGSSGVSSAFGATVNPISPSRIAGGSSSGSAASVALDLCDVSLGSDTGGSIRNPASHCGVVGIKPSYGRVSRYGLIDLSMSLDQIGPFTKDINGSALVLSVLAGGSENDGTTFDEKVPDYTAVSPSSSYKIGIVKEFEDMIVDEEIKEVYKELVEKLKANHEVKVLSLKHIPLAVQAYYPIVYTEFFSGTRKFDGIKYGKKIEEYCGEEVLRRILGGQEISRSEYEGTYYRKALKVMEMIEKEIRDSFNEVDFILAPVTPKLPHKLGENLTAREEYAYDGFTVPANLAGICGGVTNYRFIEKEGETLAIGMQVLADKLDEVTMFKGLELIENYSKENK